jgi:prepilin-type N-terminal cleavage/methylation domain-containing protein
MLLFFPGDVSMKRLQEKGFSLLEVLVALAIFVVLWGALLTLLKQEKLLLRSATEMFHARLIANETMEALKGRAFEKLESSSFKQASKLKDVTVNVLVSDFGANTLKKLVVTVQWVDGQGREKHLSLATLRSQYSVSETKGGGGQ